MPRFLLLAALFSLAALSGCCHPCCAPGGSIYPGPDPGCSRGHCWQLAHWRGKFHGLLQPPRPAEVTPPVPRFHPVPARPVFEIPPAVELPAGSMPVLSPTGQPLPPSIR